jgi:putative endonuclease
MARSPVSIDRNPAAAGGIHTNANAAAVAPVSGPPVTRQARGARAEGAAAAWLAGRGLVLLERNWRCRAGEIDLIFRHGEVIVFVEVRQRASSRYGGAAASIDARKQRKLLTAARLYLAASAHGNRPCRFDALLMGASDTDIEWIRNAFGE